MRNSILGTFGTLGLAVSVFACGSAGTTTSSDPTHPISPPPPPSATEDAPPPPPPMVTIRRIQRAPGEKTTIYVYSASTIAAGGNDVTQQTLPDTGVGDAEVKQAIAAHSTVLVWTDAPTESYGRFFMDVAADAVLVAPAGPGYVAPTVRTMKLKWTARPNETVRGTVCDQFVGSLNDSFLDIQLPATCGGSTEIPITLYSFAGERAQARTRLSARHDFGSEVQMPAWELPELAKLSVAGAAYDYDVRVRAVKDGLTRSGMYLRLPWASAPTIIHDTTADIESFEVKRGLAFMATFSGPRPQGDVMLDLGDVPVIRVKKRPAAGERGYLDIEFEKPSQSGAFATTLFSFTPSKLWVDVVQPLPDGALSVHLALPKLPANIEALAVAAGGGVNWSSTSTLVQQNPNLTISDVFSRRDLALVPGRTLALSVF